MLKVLFFCFIIAFLFVVCAVIIVAHNMLRIIHKMKGTDKPKSHTKSDIVDTRPQDVANRKIFSQDEGEYVDFKDLG